MSALTEDSKKVLQSLINSKSKKASKKVSSKKTTKKPSAAQPKTTKKTAKKTRRKKRSSKGRVSAKNIKKNKLVIHQKVKDISPSIPESQRPMHSASTIEEYKMSTFRKEIAKGCRKCKGVGYNSDNNWCECQKVICDGDFITYYDQFTYWYNSKVNFKFRRESAEDKKRDSKKG